MKISIDIFLFFPSFCTWIKPPSVIHQAHQPPRGLAPHGPDVRRAAAAAARPEGAEPRQDLHGRPAQRLIRRREAPVHPQTSDVTS